MCFARLFDSRAGKTVLFYRMKIFRTLCIASVLFAMLTMLSCKTNHNAPPADTPTADTSASPAGTEHVFRLGAYVWYGFSYTGSHYTDRLYSEFAGREPEWGWTERSNENMAYQIKIAKEYGLTFFAFDWYYGNPRLNNAVTDFLRAEGHDDFSFCLMVANHEGARITRDNWQDACMTFKNYMSRKSALKVDGKPVIIFYDIYNLIADLGGVDGVRECFDYLRGQFDNGAYIMGCECPYGTPSTGAIDSNFEGFSADALKKRLENDRKCGFDALTGYNYRRYSPVNGSYELAYTTMTLHHEKAWNAMAKYTDLAYAPCILSGWDCRPWETDWPGNTTGYRSCYGTGRNAGDFRDHIINAYKWLLANPEQNAGNLGLIYAWDEVCEGGFLIPTKGEGYEMLNGVKQAVETIDRGEIR